MKTRNIKRGDRIIIKKGCNSLSPTGVRGRITRSNYEGGQRCDIKILLDNDYSLYFNCVGEFGKRIEMVRYED